MRPTRLGVLLTGALLLAGCQLTLFGFVVPATVPPGQVFDVLVRVSASSQQGDGGVVLQLPNGFVVVGTSVPGSGVVRDDPALLALYAAEPGHYLASWSRGGSMSGGAAPYYAYVQAPAVPTTATFKVALAGRPQGQAWQVNAPPGITQFAQITGQHAQPINVAAVPPIPFAPDAIGLPYGTYYASVWSTALHDLDGDGDDDLLANHRAFLRGAASWTEASTGLVNPTPLTRMRVAAGDFDGDGFVDIVHGRGAVFFGNGGASWTPAAPLPLSVPTLGVAVGDVNGDGRDDVAFSGYFANELRVLLGNANRTFTDASTGLAALPDFGGEDVLLRDVTGDGHLDVVWNRVWAGNGQGQWTPSSGMVGTFLAAVDAGDLDGDGLPEVVQAIDGGGGGVVVYRHLGANTWSPVATIAPPGRQLHAVAVLDDDRDGVADLVVGYADTTNGIELWRNAGGFVFTPVLATTSGLPATTATYVNELAVGDVNGDTFPDVAAVWFGQGVAVYQNWRAGLSNYGAGCAATIVLPPTVEGTSAPLLGSATFGVRVAGGQPGTLALAWLGTSRHAWSGVPVLPLELAPFGAPPGCTLWTGPEASVGGVFDAAGTFTLPVPIPAVPALRRVTVFAQGAAFSPGSGAPLPFAFTAGLAIRVD